MDIAGLSMLQSQHIAGVELNTALLKKVKETADEHGQRMNQMLEGIHQAERIAEPYKGTAINIRA
ncbi:putative motility protein [Geomicrobium sp. JSM 1781026]|uniref:putative motility protein n=1 Tax=Geomicrobium sp. JSM 1781026 TaxID=3344580 RepID=UPI0035C09BA7